MAAFTALPEAFFFSRAVLKGVASTPSFKSAYSLATEMHWLSRLSRARMYIAVGTLFCVTLPDEIRYGIGVRICAPSMPLPSEPSTKLSRVVPHDACLATSTSGMPYLANSPLSLATNSGPASLSAMNPSVALVTSGPAPCAKAPPGKFNRAAASKAAAPPVAFRSWRRLRPRREVGWMGFVMGIVVLFASVRETGPSDWGHRARRRRARSRVAPEWRRHIRMSGLEGRLQWRRHKLFKLRAKPLRRKNLICFSILRRERREIRRVTGTGSRIRNLRFAQFLCVAQELGRQGNSPALGVLGGLRHHRF